MKQFSFNFIVILICMLTSCESNYEQCILSVDIQKHHTNYYQEATKIFSTITGNLTRSDHPISPSIPPERPISFVKYSPFFKYGENIENVLALSDTELEALCMNTNYQEMCQILESEVDESLSYIYDYMSIDEFKSCEEAVINYVTEGGHNIDLLDELTCEMENDNVYKLACYSAALFDIYVGEDTVIDFNGRDIVSDSQQLSCEEIRAIKLAILQLELTSQYLVNLGFTVANPAVGASGFAVTCGYGLAMYIIYEAEYRNCVKKRNNSSGKP